ncbi:MAG: hypothetical protein A2252_04210 [Elusimicrobia bacterium RIFOXYA2_FULL_39_19]|nr:MAG: hypothetical protein A2252_04210 [Elusimicrobia bacterium RIFOXYA2_FULL_39_19]
MTDIITKLKIWIEMLKKHMEAMGCSKRTLKDYPEQLKFFVEYIASIGLADVNEITKDVILNYQAYLYGYINKRGKPISLETQYGRLTPLRTLFRFLVRKGYFLYDPTSTLEMPKRKKNLPRGILERREMYKLLNQPNVDTPLGLRDKAMLELMYSSGIRSEELRNLKIYEVDTINQEMRITQGKGGKDAIIPIGEIAAKYIDEYLKIARPKLFQYAEEVLHCRPQENNLLFITKGGKQINAGNLIWVVGKYIKRAKIEKHITPHCMRHSMAVHMLRSGANLRVVQEMLRHSSIETTQIYTHIAINDLKREHRKHHPREQSR